jgi:hypothetical protein
MSGEIKVQNTSQSLMFFSVYVVSTFAHFADFLSHNFHPLMLFIMKQT